MKAIFFDLDGTLLSMNTKQFEQMYFSSLGDFISDLIPKETFIEYLLKSTKDMVLNTEPKTNRDVFMASFGALVGADADLYEQRFYDYYDTDFQALEITTTKVNTIIKDVQLLKSKGYQLVVATNPLFPQSAVESRIRWAGLDPADFDYVSSFEKNSFCKPHLGFYEEILTALQLEGGECLMVGNDVEEDLVTQKLGFTTFLINNHKIQRSEIAFIPDHEGDYDAFHNYVIALPKVMHASSRLLLVTEDGYRMSEDQMTEDQTTDDRGQRTGKP